MPRSTPLLLLTLALACGPATNSSDSGSATTDPGTTDATTNPASTTADPTTTATPTSATGEPTTTATTTSEPATTTSEPATTSDDTGSTRLCEGTSTSDLPGVSIVFPPQDCTFTLAEAAAGLSFQYTITIAQPVADVTPFPSDAGGCDQPDASGLIPFATIAGNDQSYCLCDQGLCPGLKTTADLAPGEFPGTIEWSGVNWSGPSDTDNPKGPPFPPGDYEVELRAPGTVGPEGKTSEFTVLATLPITLVP